MLQINQLQAEGFKNLKIHALEFPPEGNILVTGLNESGKSTLFEAIFFALTGDLIVQKKRGYNDAVAFDKNTARVVLDFQKAGVAARITRTIGRTGSGTTTDVQFVHHVGGAEEVQYPNDEVQGNRDINKKIKEFLQFDKDILLNSCFVQQKGLDGFIDTGKQDKLRIINKLTNLETFSLLKKQYKREKKEFEAVVGYFDAEADKVIVGREIAEIENQINELTALVDQHEALVAIRETMAQVDFPQFRERHAALQAQLTEIHAEETKAQGSREGLQTGLDILEHTVELDQQITHKNGERANLQKDHARVTEKIKEITRQLAQQQERASRVEVLEGELAAKQPQWTQLASIEEPLSQSSRLASHAEALAHQLQTTRNRTTELLEELKDHERTLLDRLSQALTTARDNLARHDQETRGLASSRSILQVARAVQAAQQAINGAESRIAQVQAFIEQRRANLQSLQERVKARDELESELASLARDREDADAALATVRSNLEAMNEGIQVRERFEDLSSRLKTVKDDRQSALRQIDALDEDLKTERGGLEEHCHDQEQRIEEITQEIQKKTRVKHALVHAQAAAERDIHDNILRRLREAISAHAKKKRLLVNSGAGIFVGLLGAGLLLSILVAPAYFILAGFSLVGLGLVICAYKELGPMAADLAPARESVEDLGHHLAKSPPHEVKFLDPGLVAKNTPRENIKLIQNQIARFENYIAERGGKPISIPESSDEADAPKDVSGASYFFRGPQDYSYDLHDQLQQVTRDLETANQERERLTSDSAQEQDRKRACQALEEEIEEETRSLAALEHASERLTGQIEDLSEVPETELAQLKEEQATLERQKIELEERIRNLASTLAEKQEQLTLKSQTLDESAQQIEQMEKQIARASREIEWREAEVQLFKAAESRQLARLPPEKAPDAVASIEEFVAHIRARITQHETSLEHVQENLHEVSRELGLPSQDTHAQWRTRLGRYDEVLDHRRTRIAHLTSAAEDDSPGEATRPRLGQYVETVTKTYEPFGLAHRASRDQLLEKHKVWKETMEQAAELTAQLTRREQERARLVESIAPQYQEDPAAFKDDLEACKVAIEQKKASIQGIKAQIAEFDEERAQQKLETLTTQQTGITETLAKIEADLATLAQSKEDKVKEFNEAGFSTELLDKIELRKARERLEAATQSRIQERAKIQNEIAVLIGNLTKQIQAINTRLEPYPDLPGLSAGEQDLDLTDAGQVVALETACSHLATQVTREIDKLHKNADLGEQDAPQAENPSSLEDLLAAQREELGARRNRERDLDRHLREAGRNEKLARAIESYRAAHPELPPAELQARSRRDLQVIEQALALVETAEVELTQIVLPRTMELLIHILPILTADRYKDVKINDRYEVRVFDSKMGGYVEKTLFSGGTNDQIALGIRLAFAMATMNKDQPESFIFLDEPLGFFDDERKNCLIDFLTHGKIADLFAQRFVVTNFSQIKSHFDHIIELSNGEVVNQVSTGSLESLQRKYVDEVGIQQYLLAIHADPQTYEGGVDGGFFEGRVTICNTSPDQNIHKINLEPKLNRRCRIQPQYCYNVEPGQEKAIQISFHRDDFPEPQFQLKATLHFASVETGEPVDKQETLTWDVVPLDGPLSLNQD